MNRAGLFFAEAFMKVVAFEHLRDRVLFAQAHEINCGKIRKPAHVEVDDRGLRIQDLEDLRLVSLRVLIDLIAVKRLARRRAAGGITDDAGEIADEKNHGVAQVLKMFELSDQDSVAEVQVGRGGIEASFYAQ